MGNLPYDVSEDDVREALEALGCAAPSGVRIPLDKETNQPRGFAFVEFEQVAASLGNAGGGRQGLLGLQSGRVGSLRPGVRGVAAWAPAAAAACAPQPGRPWWQAEDARDAVGP